jgi:hypothetical protein
MKTRSIIMKIMTMCFIAAIVFSFSYANAQTDSTKVAAADTTAQKKNKDEKEKKRRDSFIIYAGANFSQIGDLNTDMGVGYNLGFDYKRGKFFYWQVGAQFNNSVYDITSTANDTSISDLVGIRSINIPITGGINFLSFTDRILALRVFISAVPGFNVGVGDNDIGFTKDSIESFSMLGQGGIGIDVAFIVLEAGYNYGFTNIFTNMDSKPGQVFVKLGFRF